MIPRTHPGHMFRPPEVVFHWMGWKATPQSLDAAGWDVSIDEDPLHDHVRFAMRHRQSRTSALSAMIDIRRVNIEDIRGAPLGVRVDMGRPLMVHMHDMRGLEMFENFEPFDSVANNQYRIEDLGNFNIFQTVPRTTEQYLLDDVSLDQILSIALDKQKPIEEKYQKYQRDKALMEKYSEPKAMLRLVA